ncbi:MAG TPA: hypothetical protein VFQ53_35700 [Kofleriaceae bacterium]|nr:hypothetical protein [Kofleriaceae bacterium]
MAVFVAVFAVACDSEPDAARLDHAQILAVRLEPAHVAPGGRARVTLLAGDDAGAVFEADPDSLSALGNAGPMLVEHATDGWYVTAGAQPDIATIGVTLTIDGTEWRAEKAFVVSEQAENPHVATMQVDGAPSTEVVAAVGAKPELTAVGEGQEPLAYAWYSSIGDLQYYRQQTAILDAAEPADGTVVVVVRDSVGGVDWQIVPASVR